MISADVKNDVIDRNGFLKRTKGDEELFIILLNIYKDTSRENLLGIKKAIDHSNFDELKKQTHSFKGSSVGIGAFLISDVLFQIEEAASERNIDKLLYLFEKLKETNKKTLNWINDYLVYT